jgi:hypothetical protein
MQCRSGMRARPIERIYRANTCSERFFHAGVSAGETCSRFRVAVRAASQRLAGSAPGKAGRFAPLVTFPGLTAWANVCRTYGAGLVEEWGM